MRVFLSYLTLLVSAVLGIGGAAYAVLVRPPQPEYISRYEATTVATAKPVALFVGDGYIAGTDQAPGIGCPAATQRGWDCANDAQLDTGYLAGSATGAAGRQTYAERLPVTARKFDPAVVVVTGGRADATAGPGFDEAAKAYYAALQAAFPKARIVIVGPFWSTADPPPVVLSERDTLAAIARDIGAVWIDPLKAKWITDENAAENIGADRTNPSAKGSAYLAGKLADALETVRVSA